MNPPFSYKDLSKKIKEIFLTQSQYKLAKHIQEFLEDGKFLGDYWTFYMFEQKQGTPPIIYSVLSPYEIVTKKAPEQAIVFQDGKVILNIDFTEHVEMRTGIMDSLFLTEYGLSSLSDKHILYIGTGKVAKQSLKALKIFFPDVTAVAALNRKGEDSEFTQIGKEVGIEVNFVTKEKLSEYDIIFCHTSSGAGNVLTGEDKTKIKKGAIITTFVSTTSDTELAEEFYDTSSAQIFIDWEESIAGTKELKAAIEKGSVDKQKIVILQQLFDNSSQLDQKADYTIYRSTGTPMQNLAALKLLLSDNYK